VPRHLLGSLDRQVLRAWLRLDIEYASLAKCSNAGRICTGMLRCIALNSDTCAVDLRLEVVYQVCLQSISGGIERGALLSFEHCTCMLDEDCALACFKSLPPQQ
jgi:hypothetical protein